MEESPISLIGARCDRGELTTIQPQDASGRACLILERNLAPEGRDYGASFVFTIVRDHERLGRAGILVRALLEPYLASPSCFMNS